MSSLHIAVCLMLLMYCLEIVSLGNQMVIEQKKPNPKHSRPVIYFLVHNQVTMYGEHGVQFSQLCLKLCLV